MDFQLDNEQIEYQKLVRDFGQREIIDVIEACEKARVIPFEVLKKVWDTGLMNVQIPESLGGLGLNLWNASLIAEGLAYWCSSIYSAIEYSALAQAVLLDVGTSEQQTMFLEPLTQKLSFGGIDLDSFFDPGSVKVIRKGDDFLLNGQSLRLLNATIADWFIVSAVETDTTEIDYFVVPAKSPGIKIESKVSAVGRILSDVHTVSFNDVELSRPVKLEGVSHSKAISQICQKIRVLIAAGMTGVAQCALDNAVKYANVRKTFGKNISQHQSIGFMMADMAKDISASRLLIYQAAVLSDRGVQLKNEALAAHAFASEAVMKATTDAVQIYGGYGYSKEYPVEKLMRDAKAYQTLTKGNHVLKSELGRQLLLCSQ